MTVVRKKLKRRVAKVMPKKSITRPSKTAKATKPKRGPANPIDLRDTVVSDKLIELPSEVRSVIGPNVELRGCRIVMPRYAELVLTDATIIRCTLVAQQPRDMQWNRIFWKDCRFEGDFHNMGLGPTKAGEGDVNGRDFRDANLHWFSLRNCAPETSLFAAWPTFVLLYPHRNKQPIRALKWPGWMTFIMTGIASSTHETRTALIMNGELVLKELAKNGTKLSLKELHDSLARLGQAVILDGGRAVSDARKAPSLN